MNKEVAMMWVDALRSGAYAQTHGSLRDVAEDGMEAYCCLGVLCDLHRRRTNSGDWHNSAYETAGKEDGVDSSAEVPPPRVIAWAGMQSSNPAVRPEPPPGGGKCIAELNDMDGWTFGQLADLIEQKWEVM